jgi:hypothetical protein
MPIQLADLSPPQVDLLRELAARYIWWKLADEAIQYPQRVMAQAMNIGDYDDGLRLARTFGDEALREVIRQA